MEKAVIDRIEEGRAVLLVGQEEREVLADTRDLPPTARPGTWLQVEIQQGRLVAAEIDREATKERTNRITSKMERLLRERKPPG